LVGITHGWEVPTRTIAGITIPVLDDALLGFDNAGVGDSEVKQVYDHLKANGAITPGVVHIVYAAPQTSVPPWWPVAGQGAIGWAAAPIGGKATAFIDHDREALLFLSPMTLLETSTLAHELNHILTNHGHPEPPPYGSPQYFLRAGGTQPYFDSSSVDNSRREPAPYERWARMRRALGAFQDPGNVVITQ